MNAPAASRGIVNVAEINPYAPRPYTFSEVALCLRDAIRAAGYASDVQVNKVDLNQRCVVLGALPPHLPRVEQLDRRKAVICNFEQLTGAPLVTGNEYVPWLRQWVVADYHHENVRWLREAGGAAQRVFELPLVPSASVAFDTGGVVEPTVDVLFFGTPNERRNELLRCLEAAGISVEVVAGAFGNELTPAIRRARLVLHVHFYASGLFPAVRFLQPVVQGVAIVCEDSVFSPLSDWSGSAVAFAPYEGLVEACRALLADPAARAEQARRNIAFAAAIDFATPFERLMRALDDAPEAAMLPTAIAAAPAPSATARPWTATPATIVARAPAPAPAPVTQRTDTVSAPRPPMPVTPPVPLAPPVGARAVTLPLPASGPSSAVAVPAHHDASPASAAMAERRPQQASRTSVPPDDSRPLTTEEIEAILAQEAENLPPEPHVQPPPLKIVERKPGEGRFGIWVVWLLIVFSCYTIWLSMR